MTVTGPQESDLRFGSPLRLAALFPLAIAGAASGHPLSMKHVGLCSQNGPEEKVTEMKLWLTGSRSWLARAKSEVRATFVMDGTICTLNGVFSGTYTGFMDCAGTKGVPITFSVK
jgi:hypothetical protein